MYPQPVERFISLERYLGKSTWPADLEADFQVGFIVYSPTARTLNSRGSLLNRLQLNSAAVLPIFSNVDISKHPREDSLGFFGILVAGLSHNWNKNPEKSSATDPEKKRKSLSRKKIMEKSKEFPEQKSLTKKIRMNKMYEKNFNESQEIQSRSWSGNGKKKSWKNRNF